MRSVTLVCGPPCAGKTTYVASRASEDDIVLDQDALARELGSSREWLHSEIKSRRANRRMRAGMSAVAVADDGNAWVIRCVAQGHRRARLAESLRADSVIVLMPPLETVLERARCRPGPRRTEQLVRRWYAHYSPASCDTLLAVF